jgi:heat shock protein HtpX
MNNLKTVALLGFLSALVVLVAQAFGMSPLMGLAIAGGINLLMYLVSDRLALAASGARPVAEHELPEVRAMVAKLASSQGLPMPAIYYIDSPQPNAFATGRSPKHAAVAVTGGILQTMNREELEGVLAHELSHVRNRDILITTIAAMLAASLVFFSRFGLFFGGRRDDSGTPIGAIMALVGLIVAPIAALLIRLAISRAREFEADASGARITGQPLALASALDKIGRATARIPMRVNPAFAELYIESPVKAFEGQGMGRLFSTHPPVQERIRRLREMAGQTTGLLPPT